MITIVIFAFFVSIPKPIADVKSMRIFALTLFLTFIASPAVLFAQSGSDASNVTGGVSATAAGGFSEDSSFEGVTNVSEQISTGGGFVGAGTPANGFVGIDEFFEGSTASTRSTAATSRRTATSTRSTRTTASRRTASRAGTTRSTLSRNSGQYVRAAASIDFDVPQQPSFERIGTASTAELHLQRIPGIQESRVAFRNSPAGTTAVLTGTVASERERRVAQQLLLLEPGINQVENLLEIR